VRRWGVLQRTRTRARFGKSDAFWPVSTSAFGVDLPGDDGDELELRATLPAFQRPINFLGWPGLAIGELQLTAPADETVLAAGLAWEQG
jgi:hypothetical protein